MEAPSGSGWGIEPRVIDLCGRNLNVSSALSPEDKEHLRQGVVSELLASNCRLEALSPWLVSLQELLGSKNLRTLDLSNNRISTLQHLIPFIEESNLSSVIVTGNPCAQNEVEISQLNDILETKRDVHSNACVLYYATAERMCVTVGLHDQPHSLQAPLWLFRMLITEKKHWYRRLLFHKHTPTRKGLEDFVIRSLIEVAPLERSTYAYPTSFVTMEDLVAHGSPHFPAQMLQSALCLLFIDFHLTLLETTRSYWRYLTEYFSIIARVSLLGRHERKYLILRGSIFWLLDWFMGPFSPYRKGEVRVKVGSRALAVDLETFFATMLALVKGVRMWKNPKLRAPTCHADDIVEEMPVAEQSALMLLFHEKCILRQNLSSEIVHATIEHMCWRHEVGTVAVSHCLRRFISRPNVPEPLTSATGALCKFVTIQDDLAALRIRMLLTEVDRDPIRASFFLTLYSLELYLARLGWLLEILLKLQPTDEFFEDAAVHAPDFINEVRSQIKSPRNNTDKEAAMRSEILNGLKELEAILMLPTIEILQDSALP